VKKLSDHPKVRCTVSSMEQARIRRLAKDNGCVPIWGEAYGAWCCGCKDGLHFGDQQCSIISMKSAERSRP